MKYLFRGVLYSVLVIGLFAIWALIAMGIDSLLGMGLGKFWPPKVGLIVIVGICFCVFKAMEELHK